MNPFPSSPRDLVEMLRVQATQRPSHPVFTFVRSPGAPEEVLTFKELHHKARAIGARLQELGLGGERVLLVYHCDLDYIAGFFGCLYAGAIAVPVYPPLAEKHLPRLDAIIEDCSARLVLSSREVAESLAMMEKKSAPLSIPVLATDGLLVADLAWKWKAPAVGPDSVAFLQYTSGSTGQPKGVMLTHANLIANFEQIRAAKFVEPHDVILTWLPLYHDMGLIGAMLSPVYMGAKVVLMPPQTMVRPLRWLQAVSKYRATVAGGPNFAYQMCVDRISDEQAASLDLSSWKKAINGAEPIRASTLLKFNEKFGPVGFNADVHRPAYGLAEATLFVTARLETEELRFGDFDAESLEARKARSAPEGSSSRRLVSCGRPVLETRILIVDPESGSDLPAGRIGEIWVSGASVASGYWNQPELSRQVFGEFRDGRRWLRTGDMGFLDESGELFVTGRMKDLIIIRGRNFAPQDLELAAEGSHPLVKGYGAAAFSLEDEGTEKLILVQEVHQSATPEALAQARQAISDSINHDFGLNPAEIRFIIGGTLLRTSSGKVRRTATKEAYLSGTLRMPEVLRASVEVLASESRG